MSQNILISLNDCVKRTSLSRTQINKLRTAGRFPRAVVIEDSRRVAFVAAEVDQWIADRIAARDKEAA